MISQVQQVTAGKAHARRRPARIEQHLVTTLVGQVENAHHQVVVGYGGQALCNQLVQAQQGHHITSGQPIRRRLIAKDGSDHQQATGVGRLDIDHVQRRGHRHAAACLGPGKWRGARRLPAQVETIGLGLMARRLGIQDRVIVVAHRSRL